MNYEFLTAKNGEKTIKINNVFFHSAYNPSNEAKKFIENTQFAVKPSVIFIIEPGLSYLPSLFKEKFPESKICAIRFTEIFSNFNIDWDYSFNFFLQGGLSPLVENTNFLQGGLSPFAAQSEKVINTSDCFEKEITSIFTEEELCSSVFINWTPSLSVFKEENSILWNIIKKIIEKSRTILVTREYFEEKWLLNTCNFIKYFSSYNNSIFNEKINLNIVIAASGPSLTQAIPIIISCRKKIFLICLSSAISVLNYYKIEPDLYFSTDGGYWAGKHLVKINQKIPLCIPYEGYCHKSILKNNFLIPLNYGDGISSKIIDFCNLPFVLAERNGTVSGSALRFAQKLTNQNIYFLGLDLKGGKGFQHTSPNLLEINNSINDFRIKNLETRQTKSRYSSDSLLIYRTWFENLHKTENIFRVIEDDEKFGKINQITYKEFEKSLNDNIYSNKHPENRYNFTQISKKDKIEYSKKLLEFINTNIGTEEWNKQLYPLDYVSMSHSINENQIKLMKNKLSEKNEKILKKIRRFFDAN